ncbi:MAG TPA: BspA family leucine-rich repeat surface protein, partial [Ruminococcus flavefaciens]|nr:BspA family leucine-rich repeat surface protein [Ruminococcus flavefaciens]
MLPADCSYLFYLFYNTQSIDLSNADSSNVTNMHSMFSMCTNVNSINLSGIDTSHVTDMCMMFWCNYKLTSLVGITEFDTSNVTDMNGMFFSCSVLPTL